MIMIKMKNAKKILGLIYDYKTKHTTWFANHLGAALTLMASESITTGYYHTDFKHETVIINLQRDRSVTCLSVRTGSSPL